VVTVLIAGGGTGGHVFPMVAVGDALRALGEDVAVVYVGTARGIEARVMPERGDDLELMNVLPLRGGGVRGLVRGVARAALSVPEARALVRRRKPDVVLSLGGYAAGPVALAARTLGVPLAILEPNSVLGLTNRLLSPLARRAYTAFPEVERGLRPSVVMRAGVPLRRAFAPIAYEPRPDRVALLVLGGSLGAAALNDIVPRAIAAARLGSPDRGAADRSGPRLDIVHQTGKDRQAAVRALYAELGVQADVVPFIDDVASAIGRADLVIGRSGASAVAELCAVGRASILIPFPFAVDDHQLHNARSLERAGATVAIPQPEASAPRIAREIEQLAADPERRRRMARAAAALGRPDAASQVARDLLDIARESAGARAFAKGKN
jgi:UDP-N-acetylglucosamine--N-acetylmuramyl-(pentapeptide) pyrophosphoryl-undecaprenol N-acetylglucosamine transferase